MGKGFPRLLSFRATEVSSADVIIIVIIIIIIIIFPSSLKQSTYFYKFFFFFAGVWATVENINLVYEAKVRKKQTQF